MSSDAIAKPVVEALWGLSKATLLPIVQRAVADQEITDFSVTVRHEVSGYKGYCAEKVIPTFHFRTARGEDGEVTLFVKRMGWPGRCESLRYEALQPLELPLPRYYGFCLGERGEDIVFLEFIKDIGLNPGQAEEARQLVQGVARINAAKVPEALQTCGANDKPFQPSGVNDHVRIERWQSVVRKAWQHGLAGDLGKEVLEFCSKLPMATLLSFAEPVGARLSHMRQGLNHNDINYQNLGWREGRKELLFFDLHKMGLSPRFSDLASISILGPLGREFALSRNEILEVYLSEYQRLGGQKAEVEDLDEEVGWLENAGAFGSLNWLLSRSIDGKVDWTPNVEEGRRQNWQWLLEGLRILWTRASGSGWSARDGTPQ